MSDSVIRKNFSSVAACLFFGWVLSVSAPLTAESDDGLSIDLGTPEIVHQSDHSDPISAEMIENSEEEAIEVTADPSSRSIGIDAGSRRQVVSGVVRSMIPDHVEIWIPEGVFQRLADGPTPEQLERREQRRAWRNYRRAPRP